MQAAGSRDLMLLAPLVLPVDGPPIVHGAVLIRGDRIIEVGPEAEVSASSQNASHEWLEASVIVPGFVNAHAHLELSAMGGQISRPADCEEDFTGWIRRVLRIREGWDASTYTGSTRQGCRYLLESGCTTVGDISSNGLNLGPLVASPLRAVAFREVLGFGPEAAVRAQASLKEWFALREEIHSASDGRVSLGISPHAPYSTSSGIYRSCADLATRHGCLLTTHVSETLEELEFTRTGAGAFRDLLTMRGILPADLDVPGVSPVAYLQRLGVLDCAGPGAHLNYLLPGDLEILAACRMKPVYCPQSHLFFGRRDHPAPQLLASGIPLALGTDSLASNSNLQMLAEMRAARALHPSVSPSIWLRCATLHGAAALGMQDEIGSLTPGKKADLAVILLDPEAEMRSAGRGVRSERCDGYCAPSRLKTHFPARGVRSEK